MLVTPTLWLNPVENELVCQLIRVIAIRNPDMKPTHSDVLNIAIWNGLRCMKVLYAVELEALPVLPC